MGNVNEDDYIARCPKCGNTELRNQVPITLGTPAVCSECPNNPWKLNDAYDRILYYLCMICKIEYKIPKLEREDTEYRMFGHDG